MSWLRRRSTNGRRTTAIIAVVAAVVAMVVAAGARVVPTEASWADPLTLSTPVSAGTWDVPPPPLAIRDGGITAGNTATAVSAITWTKLQPNTFCTVVAFTGTSAEPEDWKLRVDLDRIPFRGLRADQVSVYRGLKVAGPDNTLLISGISSHDPNAPFDDWSNNTPITNARTATVEICLDWGTTPQGDPDWYTTAVTPGTGADWSDRRACLTLTAATTQHDLTANPFFYGWTATLDMSSAIARVTGSGHHAEAIEWRGVYPDGTNLTTTPPPGGPPSASYTLVSGASTALRATGSGHEVTTVTACVVDY